MGKTKGYFVMFLVVIIVFSAVACRKKTPSETVIKIGVCIITFDNVYLSSVRQAIEDAALDISNVELIVKDSKADQTIQNKQIDDMIEDGVKALAINIVDLSAAQEIIEKARKANIPIVFFNREPNTDIIKSYDKARFVGTNPEEAGIIQGELILDIWRRNPTFDKNGDGEIQYVMLQGDIENPETIARTQFSINTITDRNIHVEKLGEASANWSSDLAKALMQDWLAEHGDKIEFVIANNDSMAIGAIAALQEAGYNMGDGGEYIPVVGVDATDAAVDLIGKSYMSGTVKQDATEMGNAVFKLVSNAAAGNNFIANSKYRYDVSGVAVRIPYQLYSGK